MHACEGYSGPNGETFCPGMARKYLITEMIGAVPATPPFTMYLCSDCRLHAEWLYGRPSEDEPAYWWHMERCDVATLSHDPLIVLAQNLFIHHLWQPEVWWTHEGTHAHAH
jgi:hypothetical protein